MAGDAFFPSMGNISNRTLIKRMEQWGWKVKKTKGPVTLMEAPHGVKIEVASGGMKVGNSPKTFIEILKIMNLTWEEFIRPLDAEEQLAMEQYAALDDEERRLIWEAAELKNMVDLELVKAQQRAQQLRIRDERRQQAKIERDRKRTHPTATPLDVSKPIAPPEPEAPKEEPVNARHDDAVVPEEDLPPVKPVKEVAARTSGLTNRILDHLVKSDEPMSLERLRSLEPDARADSISAACSNLVKYGVAMRVKPGVYRIRDEARRNGDVRVDIGLGITAEAAPPAPPAPVQPPAPVEPQPPVIPSEVVRSEDVGVIQTPYAANRSGDLDYDEVVTETLDLLFPQGFKAKHLPLIDRWRQATIALMRDING